MTEEEKKQSSVSCDAVCEDAREERAHRRWMAKAGFLTFCVIAAAGVITLIYAAIIQDKDFETGFLGQALELLIEVLKLVLG